MSTPRTVERYIESPGTRRKRRRVIFICLVLLVIFCFSLGAMWIVIRSGFFVVREIHVEGSGILSDAEVIQDADDAVLKDATWQHFLGTRNILVWPSVLTSNDLKLTPHIAGMTITKDYWHGTVSIAVEPRMPKGIWCKAQVDIIPDAMNATGTMTTPFSCFTFDQSGFIFDSAPHAEGGLLHVVDDYTGRKMGIGSTILPQNFIGPIISIFNVLEQSESGVKELRLKDLGFQEVRVITYNGPMLLFSLRFDAADTLPVLLSLQSRLGFKNLQYVDFRTQGRVYYR